MKQEPKKTPSPLRTARPIQPTLVVYLPHLEPSSESSEAIIDALGKLDGWNHLLKKFDGASRLAPRPAFTNWAGLQKLVDKANENFESETAKKNPAPFGVRGYQPLDFKRYVLMSIPVGAASSPVDSYCALKSDLKRLLGAEVYLSMPTRRALPWVDYRAAATDGVGADPLLVNGTVYPPNTQMDGSGEWIVDIEKAWLTDDVNPNQVTTLPRRTPVDGQPIVVVESAEQADIDHGTGVAGIVLGSVTDPTIVGLAPGATFIKGACLELSSTKNLNQTLASTIADAAVYLSENAPPDAAGARAGVILIEQETAYGLPIETSPLEFSVIQTAVLAGNVVVQPAGNGEQDLNDVKGKWLDASTDPKTERPRSLDPSQNDPTSGAITVAAAFSGLNPAASVSPRDRGDLSEESNFGGLVDCWAWGDSIATLGVTRDAQGRFVTISRPVEFGGTSGASAIIAGVILLMQQIRSAKGKSRLNAGQVRDLLRNTTTTPGTGAQTPFVPVLGTPGLNDLDGKYMPDLVALQSRVETM